MIKLVTFDLDDTLWSVRPVVTQADARLWEWLATKAPEFVERFTLSDFSEGSEMRKALMERYPEISHSVSEIRLRLLKEGFVKVGYDEKEAAKLSGAAFDYFIQFRHAVTPYDQAIPMLRALKEMDLQIAALSNGNADIHQTPLAPWFDFQFNADSVGTATPDSLMFLKALDKAGAKASESVHIGDHPVNDVQAAKQLGCYTIWINPEGTDWPMAADADHHISCLSEIPTTIRKLINP